ncbi:MAG: tRNA pseudouridine38-40 synthase [Candidatus Poseidoniaceae archaeon]|jgi:tRNA pseudouridine38-40 synthase|tara:strand:- start:304 stop:1224 length:921 start_codon:yes stop_codon:yes gene_type:complete
MADPSVRLAFRIGYLGDGYHGSQIQPDVKTVQGELIRVFRSLKWLDNSSTEHNLVLSSRTDAGVHVRLNGGVVTIDRELWNALTPRKMIRALDDRLPKDIAFLDVREVNEQWNPRMANYRVYRYRLEGIEFWKYPGEQFVDWLKMFEGTYDATNFARLEEGKNPMRTILSCTPWIVNGRTIGFEIKGEAFLWNQVRRTAMALHRMCIGDLEPTEILQAIRHPEIEVDFGVAPPDWLILWGVDWNEFPLPMAKQGDTPLTAPPMGPAVERTMRKRWREGARHELKNLLYQEWAGIGELPIVKHTPVT